MTVGELDTKLKNIKDTYQLERKKVLRSAKSGSDTNDLYVPKLSWYIEADSFLQPFMEIRNTSDNLVS